MPDTDIFKRKTKEINEIIYGFLPEKGGTYALIKEAADYSVRAGGKRLRPMIMRETYKFFEKPAKPEPAENNGRINMLHAFMAAIEFIHTYSLVHDDLPAMDNDDLRRGLPTTHAAYGEAFGVLAGDALLNLAFEVISKAMLENAKDEALLRDAVKAFNIISEKSGISGMIGGQSLDVLSEKKPELFRDKSSGEMLSDIIKIYEGKTSALLQAAFMTGAVLSGAGEREIRKTEELSLYVGLAFQIRDDILDVTKTTEELGKNAHSDERNNKATYVSLKGLEASQGDVLKYSDMAVKILKSLPGENPFLGRLIEFLTGRSF